MRALFEAPTLAGLAARIDAAARRERGGAAAAAAPACRRDGPLPLSFAQQRLWFLAPDGAGQPVLQHPRRRAPDAARSTSAALRRALREIVRRHEALRTTFRATAGGAVQVVAPRAELRPPPHRPARAAGGRPRRRRARWRRRRPSARSTCRASRCCARCWCALAADEHLLVLNLHHVAARRLVDRRALPRAGGALRGVRAGRALAAPRRSPVQYADFAVWQRRGWQSEVLEAQLAYWRARLAGAPAVLELPTDRAAPGGAELPRRGASPFALPARARRAAARRWRGARAPRLFMVLLAGFDAAPPPLSRAATTWWSARPSPAAGAARAGGADRLLREHPGAAHRPLAATPPSASCCGRVREATLEAYAHQDLPFERLVEELQPERDLSRNPLFQVMLRAAERRRWSRWTLPGLRSALEDVDSGTGQVRPVPGDAGGAATALAREPGVRHRPLRARRRSSGWRPLPAPAGGAGRATPTRPLAALPLLATAERGQVLAAGTAPRAAYPRDARIHALFAAQARRTPERRRRCAGTAGQMTYARAGRARQPPRAPPRRAWAWRPDEPVALLAGALAGAGGRRCWRS